MRKGNGKRVLEKQQEPEQHMQAKKAEYLLHWTPYNPKL